MLRSDVLFFVKGQGVLNPEFVTYSAVVSGQLLISIDFGWHVEYSWTNFLKICRVNGYVLPRLAYRSCIADTEPISYFVRPEDVLRYYPISKYPVKAYDNYSGIVSKFTDEDSLYEWEEARMKNFQWLSAEERASVRKYLD